MSNVSHCIVFVQTFVVVYLQATLAEDPTIAMGIAGFEESIRKCRYFVFGLPYHILLNVPRSSVYINN